MAAHLRYCRSTFQRVCKINGEMVPIPEEVIAAARSAKNEMKGAIARDIYKAGASNKGEWSAVKAKDKMNALNQKIRHAFDPEEVQSLPQIKLCRAINAYAWL